MRVLLAALVFLALPPQPVAGRTETLSLPHALRAGESAWLEVKVGVIPKGAEIEITTTVGRPLGVISPFAIRPGNPAGTYTVPLPADAIAHGRVSLRLSLNYPGQSRRAPTLKEVKRLRVKVASAQRSIQRSKINPAEGADNG